jgi:hypothetical protein
MIQAVYPAMRIEKTREGVVPVRGRGLGGATTLSTANALRMDRDLRDLGIRLDEEFLELERELPISTDHQRFWNADNRLLPRTSVHRVVVNGGKATGVVVHTGLIQRFFPADLVILAAGGLVTPALLERSGVACSPRLFVDPVLCVAGRRKNAFQQSEIPMPFAVQRDGYILSPYFDLLSFFFNPGWRVPASDILSVMIKLADATLLPVSLGNPPSLTIMALARSIARLCIRRFSGLPKTPVAYQHHGVKTCRQVRSNIYSLQENYAFSACRKVKKLAGVHTFFPSGVFLPVSSSYMI